MTVSQGGAGWPTLQATNNILAVEIHNRAQVLTDPAYDIGFDVSLTGLPVREPYLQLTTPTSTFIRWDSEISQRGAIQYRPVGSAASPFQVADAAPVVAHELKAAFFPASPTALLPHTLYEYKVGFLDAGNVFQPLYNGTFADPAFRFLTAPVPGSAKRTRVWVLGDSGESNANLANVCTRFSNFNAGARLDLMLMMGDNAYENGTQANFQTHVFDPANPNLAILRQVMKGTALFPTIGNHETANAGESTNPNPAQLNAYPDIFTLPTAGEAGGVASGTEKFYSFDHGNIHFVCLDSQTSPRIANVYKGFTPGAGTGDPLDTWSAAATAGDDPMIAWLKQDLQQNDKEWLIAFWHHPPYSKGGHNSDTEVACRDMRWNAAHVLEDYGVDLVLSGHSHNYQRSNLINGYYYGGTNDATRTTLVSQTTTSPITTAVQSAHVLHTGTGSAFGSADNVTGAYLKSGGSTGPAGVATTLQNRFTHEGTVYCLLGNSARPFNAFANTATTGGAAVVQPHWVMLPKATFPAAPTTAEQTGSYDNLWTSALIEVQGNRLDVKVIADRVPAGSTATFTVVDNFTILKKFKTRELPAVTTFNGAYQSSVALSVSEENVVAGGVSNVWPNQSAPKPGDPRVTSGFNSAWDARGTFVFNAGTGRVSGIFSGFDGTGNDEPAASGFSGTRMVNGSTLLFTGYSATPAAFTSFDSAAVNLAGQPAAIRGNFAAGYSFLGMAARWDLATSAPIQGTDLGVFTGGSFSYAAGVNTSGQAIGYADNSGGSFVGFRTSATGTLSTAANLGVNCLPWDITEQGITAGEATFGASTQAFLLPAASTAVVNSPLASGGHLLGTLTGFTGSRAAGLNDWQIVVGTATKPAAPASKGFYFAGGRLMPLATFAGGTGGTTLNANPFAGADVNNRGLIAVNVELSGGIIKAFVLDPTPRP